MRKRNNLELLLGAAALTVALWLVPFGSLLLLPIQYLNTHIHELFHALAAMASGGMVAEIRVFGNGSGVTLTGGGLGILIASAGYVGAALAGALLISSAKTEKGVRTAFTVLLASLIVAGVLWLRGDPIGVLSAAFWIAALFMASRFLSGDALKFCSKFLGMQLCLSALQSLLVLLRISAYPGIENDAAIAERITGIPAMAWALIWSGFSLGLMAWALRSSLRGAPNRKA
jgi:hypothetical protein